MYKKGESAVSFQDVQDCLVYVSSSFSTRTSYENQTKKAITNKFISQAMTDFLKHYLEVYFLEKPEEAQKICQQVLVNKQSGGARRKDAPEHQKRPSPPRSTWPTGCRSSWTAAPRTPPGGSCISWRAIRPWARSRPAGTASSRPSCPSGGKILNCLKADYARIFKSDVIVDLIKVMGCGIELGGQVQQGAGHLQPVQPAVQQDRHLYRCGRGRLPDPHPGADHAVPPDPHPASRRGYVYIAESPPV